MHSKDIKQVKNHIIILLTPWTWTPFQTHTGFSIEMLWTIFMPTQNFPIHPMLIEDTH